MVTRIGTEFGIDSYLADTATDINSLPTKINVGSTALCVENGKIYIFNGSKEWVEFGGDGE